MAAKGVPARCGHGTRSGVTSWGRCWDCHLANLRANGDAGRAERLDALRRQHDEGRFDMDELEAGMVGRIIDEYARGHKDPSTILPRPARRLRDGRPS